MARRTAAGIIVPDNMNEPKPQPKPEPKVQKTGKRKIVNRSRPSTYDSKPGKPAATRTAPVTHSAPSSGIRPVELSPRAAAQRASVNPYGIGNKTNYAGRAANLRAAPGTAVSGLARGAVGGLAAAETVQALHQMTPAHRRSEWAQGEGNLWEGVQRFGQGIGNTIGEMVYGPLSEDQQQELTDEGYQNMPRNMGELAGTIGSNLGLMPKVNQDEFQGYTSRQDYINRANTAGGAQMPPEARQNKTSDVTLNEAASDTKYGEDQWQGANRGSGTGQEPARQSGPRIVREPGQSPILTNLAAGNQAQLSGNTVPPGANADTMDLDRAMSTGLGDSKARGGYASFTDEAGNKVNGTDAWIREKLADSKHRQEMTRGLGRISENGQADRKAVAARTTAMSTRKLGGRPSLGMLAGLVAQSKQRRGGRRDGLLDLKQRELDMKEQEMFMTQEKNVTDKQYKEAQTRKLDKEVEGIMTVEQRQAYDAAVEQDKQLAGLYKGLQKEGLTEEDKLNISNAIRMYKNRLAYGITQAGSDATGGFLGFGQTPAVEQVIGEVAL